MKHKFEKGEEVILIGSDGDWARGRCYTVSRATDASAWVDTDSPRGERRFNQKDHREHVSRTAWQRRALIVEKTVENFATLGDARRKARAEQDSRENDRQRFAAALKVAREAGLKPHDLLVQVDRIPEHPDLPGVNHEAERVPVEIQRAAAEVVDRVNDLLYAYQRGYGMSMGAGNAHQSLDELARRIQAEDRIDTFRTAWELRAERHQDGSNPIDEIEFKPEEGV